MTVEELYARYGNRIQTWLRRLADGLVAAGWQVDGPFEMSDEDYQWGIVAQSAQDREGKEAVDVRFTICESEHWNGEEGGVNFMIEAVERGGRMLGGITPFNYTPQVWVNRTADLLVEERFRLVEESSVEDWVQLLSEKRS